MKKQIFLLVVFSALGYSQSLEYYFGILKKNNPLLSMKKSAILIDREKTALSNTFENPTLSLGANDLLLDNFSKRDIEPMQTQYLSISQKFPTNGKLKLKTNISKSEERVSKLLYKDLILKLESSLAFEIFNQEILKRKLSLIDRYIKNVKKLEKLHIEHLSISQVPQIKIERTKLLKKQLYIKKNILKKMLSTSKYKIEKLLYTKLTTKISLKLNKNTNYYLNSHPLLLAYKEKIKGANEELKLKRASRIPDAKLSVGYFQRQNRSDYLSVGVALALPIRGREEKNINISMQKLSIAKDEYKDIKKSFKAQVSILKEELKEAKKNYYLVKNSLLPTQKEIGKLLENDIYTKNISTSEITENLNSQIQLELQAYDFLKDYFTAYSKLIYFMGGVK